VRPPGLEAKNRKQCVGINKVGRQLQSLCETQWIERRDYVLLFCAEISNIAEALHTVSDDRITTLPANPADLMHAICCPEFISTIFCVTDVLSVTLPVSKNLQNEGIEYTEAASVIADAISVLHERRTDCQHFHDVFVAASKDMQVLNVSVTIPRTTARQTVLTRQLTAQQNTTDEPYTFHSYTA